MIQEISTYTANPAFRNAVLARAAECGPNRLAAHGFHRRDDHISTSYVERSNLSLRMHLRRFTRLTNAFSKKLDNLKAAVALYVAWYNFCRVHQALRVTPAMEAGITDHIWSIAELIGAT